MQDLPYRLRPGFALLLALGLGVVLGSTSARGQSSITGEEVECQNGAAAGHPCKQVDLLSHLSINALGGGPNTRLNDIWGWTDPQTGTEWALVGRTDGVAFVDVSTPTEPAYVGQLPTHRDASTWRDFKVYDNHLYVISESQNHGVQIFDLTQLRDVAPESRPKTFQATARYSQVLSAHNIAINTETGFAYVVGGDGNGASCGGGLHMMNLENPTAPVFAGCFADPSTGRAGTGYTHDAQCTLYRGPDADYQGREVCFNANETALNIADVTDKGNPSTIANATYPKVGYTHQAWLTEDHRYLYVDDEFDEAQGSVDSTRTLVFDVTNLDNPTLVTQHLGTTPAIDHNQYIDGTYSYQANYKSGLRVLDVVTPEQPKEVAYFDTYPRANDAGFAGAWSNYPYFDSNVVLVSSIGEGLFVLEPNLPPILSFTGTPQGNGARLEWSIAESSQPDSLIVQHKPPGTSTWRTADLVIAKSGVGPQEYAYEFENLAPGRHQMRLRYVSQNGTPRNSSVVDIRILPREPYLATGPAPNPVQSQARFELTLQEAQNLRVALYDVLGRRVEVLYDGRVQSGVNRQFWIRADRWASGTYFLRVQGESIQLMRKVLITR